MTLPKKWQIFFPPVATILFVNMPVKEKLKLISKINIVQNNLVFVYIIRHCFTKFNSSAEISIQSPKYGYFMCILIERTPSI